MNKIDSKILAYVIGVALGDGNLSNPNGRATRLRITCDAKYKNLIKRICDSIRQLLPDNKVSIVYRKETYLDISCYSNKWENWLGWKAGKGSKYLQNVSIPVWIKTDKELSKECLRGLFETDGSIYIDRGYAMVGFVTIIPRLAGDIFSIMNDLGFEGHLYKIPVRNSYRYNIRISKNTAKFLETLNLRKD